MGRLDGKVALITGAARGQGAAEARLFVAEGAQVMLGDVLDADGELVSQLGERAAYLHHDVTSERDWDAIVAATRSQFGGLDVLVNNAGVFRIIGMTVTTLEEYMRIVTINQVGTFIGMKAVAETMIGQGSGSIVNISSVAGLQGSAGTIAYTASKFAVRGMTKVAALELAPFSVRVNSVHPGFIDTDMLLDELGATAVSTMEAAGASVPNGRLASSDDVAKLVCYLASDDSAYSTGSEFVVDGGISAADLMRDAPTIVLIGAGSTSFGLSTLHDLYADPVFNRATVWLVDVAAAPIARMQQLAGALEAATRRGITVRTTTDRADALPGADAVVVSVEVDRDRRWQQDFEIPQRHGVEHVLGENAGPGGLAHALRTIPLVAAIARDVERLAPDALLINFTNPEGRICTAFRRHLDQPIVGLCHEVELGRRRFSGLLGREIECRAAGLNHLTALVAARDATTGDDVTPDLHQVVATLCDGDGETFAFVRYLHEQFGVVISTSDSHAGEYYREGVEHAPPKDFLTRQKKLRRLVDGVADAIIAGDADLDGFWRWETSEPLRPILRAAITGEPERIASAILPNTDLVPALPNDCAVEVSAVAWHGHIAGDRTDDLPLAFAATLRHEVAVQQLVADAAILGSRDAALQALLIDPVVGSSRAAEGILADFETTHGDLWPALS